MRVRILPLLVACLALSPSRQSQAAPSGSGVVAREANQTHVLGFAAGDHFDQAEALTRALKKALEHSTNQKLGSGEFSLDVLTAALGCAEKPDQTCLKKIAAKISSPRYLWGTIDIQGQRVDAELHLYTEDGGDRKTKFSYQSSMTDSMDADLLGIAANAVSHLIGPLRYRVVVRSSEKAGVVLVDGKEAGTLVNGEATLEVQNGDHQFRLRAPGSSQDKSNNERTLAEQGARVQIAELTRVRLDPVEGELTGPSTAAPTAKASPKPANGSESPRLPAEPFTAEKPSASNSQRTWGYVALGAGGVLLAGGAAAATGLYLLNNKDNFQRYRDGLKSSEDACTEADGNRVVPGAMTPSGVRDLCRKASLLEITQIVLLAGGVVAAGTGLTLLLTSKSPSETALIQPRVVLGRDRSDVSVVVRF